MWLKISCAQIFSFCNSNVTTFQTRENVKISIFPFKLSREKCCIFKSIFYEFSKTFSLRKDEKYGYCGWKFLVHRGFGNIRNVAIVFENFLLQQRFWFCNSDVTTFRKSRKCKNFNFSFYTVPAEMLYLQKYLTNIQKHSLCWKKRNMAIVVENFLCTEILVFFQ